MRSSRYSSSSSGSGLFKVAFAAICGLSALVFVAVIGFWIFVGWGVLTHSDDIGHAVGSFAHSVEQGYKGGDRE